jgi:hypothetical protein
MVKDRLTIGHRFDVQPAGFNTGASRARLIGESL